MIEHRCKSRKPFKVGNLLRYHEPWEWLRPSLLFLVLDLKWDSQTGDWLVTLLVHQTGTTEVGYAQFYEPAEPSDD